MEHSEHFTLGQFLRSRRERLTPEVVGITPIGRRRTPGLRREEVAYLANIGISWYTSLEQDNQSNPSDQVLDSLAQALRLSNEEKLYLYRLARPAVIHKPNDLPISEGLKRTVLSLDPNPAMILKRNWDLAIWNRAAEFVFRLPSYETDLKASPNWLERFLSDKSVQSNSPNWEKKAQVMIARFRAHSSQYPLDDSINKLINELMETNTWFRHYWNHQDIQIAADCHKEWSIPHIGNLEFEYVTLQTSEGTDLQLIIYVASPATSMLLQNHLKR